MEKLGGFANSVFATRKMDDVPEGSDWSLALIDCLIAREIEKAAIDGNSTEEYLLNMMQMVEERVMDWCPTINP